MDGFERADGEDTRISTTSQRISEGRNGDLRVFIIETVHLSNTDTTRSTLVVDAADYSLVHHRVKAARDSAALTANRGHLTGWAALPGEPIRLVDRQLDHPVFPVEGQVLWLSPLLPLEAGYRAAIPHFSQWEGGEQWSVIHVLGSERVDVGGVSVDCWKVDGGEVFPGYRITYWVAKRTRRVVRGVARGEGGGPEYWAEARSP